MKIRNGHTVPDRRSAAREWQRRLRLMKGHGVSYYEVARLSGLSHSAVKNIAAGQAFMRRSTEELLERAVPRLDAALRLKRAEGRLAHV